MIDEGIRFLEQGKVVQGWTAVALGSLYVADDARTLDERSMNATIIAAKLGNKLMTKGVQNSTSCSTRGIAYEGTALAQTDSNMATTKAPNTLVGGTRTGGVRYWDGLQFGHQNQTSGVLGQVGEACGPCSIQSVLLQRGQVIAPQLAWEMVAAMRKFQMQGMHADDISRILQRAGVNARKPGLRTVQELEGLVESPFSPNSAIVMVRREVMIDGFATQRVHFVLVEGFTHTAFPGGNLVPMVQIVDSNEAARLFVTLQEFSQRFSATSSGRGVVIPILR